MKTGGLLGFFCGLVGLGLGLYFGITPIIEGLENGDISSRGAGLSFGVLGAIAGLTCAAWGLIYRNERRFS